MIGVLMPVSWLGFVDDAGKFSLDDRKGFIAWVREKFKGQEVVVTVKRRPKYQGTQSMRYYRGVVVPDIAKAIGVADPDKYEDVHNGIAWKFLRLADGPLGEPRRRSTSKDDMSQADMTAFIDQVITWAEADLVDCRIRRPHEVDIEHVYDPEWQ